VVDIAAPGEAVSSAYYGGELGGNRPQLGGAPNGPSGGPDWYTHSTAGTSFAAPNVAGGAALLYDASYASFPANPDARDARVMKAVLMNSAAKTLGWNNGQTPNPNGFGGVVTNQSLDNRVGAGRMDLDRAFDQLLSGTTDVIGTLSGPMGLVNPIGWDFGQVAQGITNDYLINSQLQAGTTFTATLSWFRDRQPVGDTSYSDLSFDNLDLELWSDLAGIPTNLISASNSRYNDTEHFTFAIPTTGQYSIRVRWTEELFDTGGDLNLEQYGLAWSGVTVSVPEPGTLLLLIALIPFAAGGRRRRR
jgi:subtilase family protein